ncbi:Zinc knuckle [Carpediemonas membranifera]|uniref:Zinc knuckle n=1 Tax=Carpediemonas membranifera TaxID=201153 RepID=A0A8J6E553_9EUKA|nr:Zinc knuckle [Carpediemonas membranifera]|eukprot:KAG9395317.1 Zinc knuckle [Carpediemonas membranifera]
MGSLLLSAVNALAASAIVSVGPVLGSLAKRSAKRVMVFPVGAHPVQAASAPHSAPGVPAMAVAPRSARCYKCGDRGHLADVCPRPNPVCFRCKKEGHVAKDCPAHVNDRAYQVGVVVSGEERAAQEETATHVDTVVDVEGVRAKALLDSGAGVNLMSAARAADLGLTVREPGEIRQVEGLGDQPVPVIGRVTATLGGKPEWCVVEPDVLFVGYDTLVKRGIVLPDMADKLTATTVPGSREDKLQRLYAYDREGTAADLPMFQLKLATDARPFRAWPKKMGVEDAAWVRQEVASMLRKGVIRPSLSPYASRVVLADKKGGCQSVQFKNIYGLTSTPLCRSLFPQ